MNLQSAQVSHCYRTHFLLTLAKLLLGSKYSTNKGFAEDLTEGKFSFPIVHGVHADLSNRQIIGWSCSSSLRTWLFYPLHTDILEQRPTTPTLKHRAISYLKNDTKSLEYTLGVLRSLEKRTMEELKRLGGNPGLEAIMDTLHIHEDGR